MEPLSKEPVIILLSDIGEDSDMEMCNPVPYPDVKVEGILDFRLEPITIDNGGGNADNGPEKSQDQPEDCEPVSDPMQGSEAVQEGNESAVVSYEAIRRIFEAQGFTICVSHSDDTKRRIQKIYSNIFTRFEVQPWDLIPLSFRPRNFTFMFMRALQELTEIDTVTVQEIQSTFLEGIRICSPLRGVEAETITVYHPLQVRWVIKQLLNRHSQAASRTQNLEAATPSLTASPLPRLRPSTVVAVAEDLDDADDTDDSSDDTTSVHSGDTGNESSRTLDPAGYNKIRSIFETQGLTICVSQSNQTKSRLETLYSNIVTRFEAQPWELIPSSIRPGKFSYRVFCELEQLARVKTVTVQEIQAEFLKQIRIAPPKPNNLSGIPKADHSKIQPSHIVAVKNRLQQRYHHAAGMKNLAANPTKSHSPGFQPPSVVETVPASPTITASHRRRNPPPSLQPPPTIDEDPPSLRPSPHSRNPPPFSDASTKALGTLHNLLHTPPLDLDVIKTLKQVSAATLERKKTELGEATIVQKAYKSMYGQLCSKYHDQDAATGAQRASGRNVGGRGDTSGQQLLDTMKQQVADQDVVVDKLTAEIGKLEGMVRMVEILEAVHELLKGSDIADVAARAAGRNS